MDPTIRGDQSPSLLDGGLDLRSDRGVLHRGDLLGFLACTAVAPDQVGEGGVDRGEVTGKPIDKDPLHRIARQNEGSALAKDLGCRKLQVDDFRLVLGRFSEGDEEDLAEDDVLDLRRGSLGLLGRHRRRRG